MNIVTIKWGSRYPASYVNQLRKSTRSHGLGDSQFICYTDDSAGLDPTITALPLPEIDLPSEYRWTFWRKLSLFDPALGLRGPCLYLDLDIVIVGDLRPLMAQWSGKPRFIESWAGDKTKRRAHYDRINSSVVLYDGAGCGVVLERFHADRHRVLAQYPGDQGFIHDCLADQATFFPAGLCVSFKKHCLPRFPLNLVVAPKPPPGAAVVVFHGKPDPHEAAVGFHGGKLKHRCRPVDWIPAPDA